MDIEKLKSLNNQFNKSSIDLSNVYEVYQGGFGATGSEIGSYISSTTVKELSDDLITFEKLLKIKKWPVSKILQREVSIPRVDEIARKFIQGNDKVKYFPPIVVALLPRDGENMAEKYTESIEDDYTTAALAKLLSNSNFSNKGLEKEILEGERLSNAKGLFIARPFESINFNLFAWDKSKYFAIVIDGQHRFESLKKASKDPSSEYNLWKQEVIFIDGSNLSISSEDRELNPINFYRKIFIDINKHPVQVSKAKQIIMDDNDLASLFVQSIVDDDQCEESKYIKPELIDWHTTASKHELPYVTSVLNLHSIFHEKLLNKKDISKITELNDEEKVRQWISRLNDYFFIDDTIDEKGLPIKKLKDSFNEYKEIWKDDEFELFSFDRQTLLVAKENFEKIYRESFICFFNNLQPYSLLISFLREKSIFDRNSELSDIVLKSPVNRFSKEETQFSKLKRECEEHLNKDYFILMSVVGQKAIIDLFYNFLTTNRGSQITNERHLQLTNEFLAEYNSTIKIINKSGYKLFGEDQKNENYTNFINTEYKELTTKYPGLSTNFWSDILFYGSNIKYNSIGVRAISKILKFCIECKTFNSKEEIEKLNSLQLNEFKSRIKGLIMNDYQKAKDNNEAEAEKDAAAYVELKINYIKSIFINNLSK
ncbi:hypothetical protein ACFS5J_04075 [Flavobacterium chuncheonense]|uniref:DGQHR domain-containing protein n=1 Tax=Flavobacterium chuncheonense TaxID=2026653 RepID=A0ABW5YJD5_9FLAO